MMTPVLFVEVDCFVSQSIVERYAFFALISDAIEVPFDRSDLRLPLACDVLGYLQVIIEVKIRIHEPVYTDSQIGNNETFHKR